MITIFNTRVTAAYLACKVEEFNVSIDQFIANIKGDKERAMVSVHNMSQMRSHAHSPNCASYPIKC